MGVITGNWHLILLYIPRGYILKGRWVGFIFISLPPSLVYIFSFCYSTHQGDAAEYKITPCQYFSWAPFSSYKHSPKSHICFFFVFLVKPKFFSLNGFEFALKMAGNELNWMAKKKNFHQLHIIIIIITLNARVYHRWIIWDQTPRVCLTVSAQSCISDRLSFRCLFVNWEHSGV